MQTTERFEKVDIDRLVPFARNARTHSKEQILQLRSSLREFGFVNPIIVDKELNIIAGHGRVLAAKAEGMTELPCVFAEHLTDTQKRAYILADNKLALNAGWDEELLALEFGELKGLGFDLELTGFGLDEIEKVFAADLGDATEDTFDIDEELQKPAYSKLGDVWTLGRHKVVCGDSTKPETYAALMCGKQANLILTDPPYAIDYDKGIAGKILNDKFDSDEDFYNFLFKAFSGMCECLANDGAVYVFHADTKGLTFRQAFSDAGFKLSGCCIWSKNTFTLGRSDYQWCHEPCLYGWKRSGKHIWYGDRKQSTIWNCDKPSRSEHHPTIKPVPLLAIPIQNSTQTNGLVLDPFGGSGSTLICCEQLGRTAFLIELDEKFMDVIINRYISVTGSSDGVFVEREGVTLPYSEVFDG